MLVVTMGREPVKHAGGTTSPFGQPLERPTLNRRVLEREGNQVGRGLNLEQDVGGRHDKRVYPRTLVSQDPTMRRGAVKRVTSPDVVARI